MRGKRRGIRNECWINKERGEAVSYTCDCGEEGEVCEWRRGDEDGPMEGTAGVLRPFQAAESANSAGGQSLTCA